MTKECQSRAQPAFEGRQRKSQEWQERTGDGQQRPAVEQPVEHLTAPPAVRVGSAMWLMQSARAARKERPSACFRGANSVLDASGGPRLSPKTASSRARSTLSARACRAKVATSSRPARDRRATGARPARDFRATARAAIATAPPRPGYDRLSSGGAGLSGLQTFSCSRVRPQGSINWTEGDTRTSRRSLARASARSCPV